ncbi:MAG: aminotransferase class III-fold pyridoxal phosphate-dependent enzyme, partial [Pseudomonadota bacterium]|nr:aminotransferase class III-fold pyridoxal phosphate-dependent enzyme [Pseudomonadota bacterium]
MSITDVNVPNDLDSLWMPFTDNRNFKKQPKLFSEAEGMYYYTPDGRKVLDGTSGLWCVNAGHRRKPIIEAVSKQVEKLDYAPGFQVGHPLSFEFASRLVGMVNEYSHVMFTNSGSESVDTALKIALAYQRNIGQGNRTRFVGRERGYHGVGFGGISVGGISPNRKMFGNMLTGIDHLKHTHNLEHNAFIKGQPEWGAHLADDLESIVALHDASNIAAVIVEPVAGSTGVLIPPKGYLQRLREICTKHGILLIFDEVITGFGRLGDSFANEYFGVKPDIFTTAKGITNATVPMGAVFVRDGIY